MKYFLFLLLCVTSLTSEAQSRTEVLERLNKLLKKANGHTITGGFVKTNNKIVSQQVSVSEIAITTIDKDDDDNTEWVESFNPIPWDSIDECEIGGDIPKMTAIILRFIEKFDYKYSPKPKVKTADPSGKTSVITLYIPDNEDDEEELKKLAKLIEGFAQGDPEKPTSVDPQMDKMAYATVNLLINKVKGERIVHDFIEETYEYNIVSADLTPASYEQVDDVDGAYHRTLINAVPLSSAKYYRIGEKVSDKVEQVVLDLDQKIPEISYDKTGKAVRTNYTNSIAFYVYKNEVPKLLTALNTLARKTIRKYDR
jgi:hypothetical protein